MPVNPHSFRIHGTTHQIFTCPHSGTSKNLSNTGGIHILDKDTSNLSGKRTWLGTVCPISLERSLSTDSPRSPNASIIIALLFYWAFYTYATEMVREQGFEAQVQPFPSTFLTQVLLQHMALNGVVVRSTWSCCKFSQMDKHGRSGALDYRIFKIYSDKRKLSHFVKLMRVTMLFFNFALCVISEEEINRA